MEVIVSKIAVGALQQMLHALLNLDVSGMDGQVLDGVKRYNAGALIHGMGEASLLVGGILLNTL